MGTKALRGVSCLLQTGSIIAGTSNLNFSTQQSSFNYTVLSPTVTDLTSYKAAISQLVTVAKGLADGGDNPCAPSDHRLDRSVEQGATRAQMSWLHHVLQPYACYQAPMH